MGKQAEIDWGLVWLDDDPQKTLRQKIVGAATRYRIKNGTWPNLCYVHPSALPHGDCTLIDGIRVVALDTVLPHHFWIGIEKERNNDNRI